MQFNIRTKLFVSYSTAFLLLLVIVGLGIFFFVRITIERNIEVELERSTMTIRSMVETAAEVSLKNYLRATAEKNREIATLYYQQFRSGKLSEGEAKERVSEILLNQHIGESGYLYAINSRGVLQVHPEPSLIGVDISSNDFVIQQKKRKDGYLAYDWQNPGEKHPRPKALYMSYFAPWDWIISVSAYRSEFRQLVKVDDFREKVLAVSFGKTGYSYVMDLKGNLVIHPQLEGHNIFQERDARGRFFIKEICRRQQGKIVYPWKNPDDPVAREKLVIFKYIPQFEWIVASSSYQEEFFSPLQTIGRFMTIVLVVALLILLPLSLVISRTITAPLQELMTYFAKQPDGDFTPRITREYGGEIGRLASYFNTFMARLEQYSADLKNEIVERRRVEEGLRQSEEMFSKAFNLSPIGILILSYPDGRIVSANDSFLRVVNYPHKDVVNNTLRQLGIVDPGDITFIYTTLAGHQSIREYAIPFFTRDRQPRQAMVAADLFELWGENYVLAIVEDVTERQQLQERILDISETERRKVGQDIHDDLCPHLIGTEVMVKILQKKLEGTAPEAAPTAGRIRELLREAIQKSRGMARGLSPVFLVDRGLEAAIEELSGRISELYGLDCSFSCSGHLEFNDSTDAIQLFMIIQEAVSNAVRHGEGSSVAIRQERFGGRLRMVVEDDGVGIPETGRGRGMGLKIMEYRAELIGGSVRFESVDSGGTRLVIRLPKDVRLKEDTGVQELA